MYHPNFSTVCSAEFLGNKVLVPCDPVAFLNRNYGSWSKPERELKNYRWPNMNYTGTWTDEQYRQSFRKYAADGSVDQKATLKFWNLALTEKIPFQKFENYSKIFQYS